MIEHAEADPVGRFDPKANGIVDKIPEMRQPDSDADELDHQRKART